MSILSEEERAVLQALPLARDRTRRAEALVNPASGLANDYLNLFNEIVMLVEQLPTMPDLIDDIMRWRPVSYRDYFERSFLPGRLSALETYEKLDPRFRHNFEAVVAELDRRSTGAVAAVRRQFKASSQDEPARLAEVCERAGAKIRETLEQATMLVNHGGLLGEDVVQDRADALFAGLAAAEG